MSTHDDDILDFDFFEEKDKPSWEEPEDQRAEPPPSRGRGPRGPRFSAPRNLTPLLRLVALIALAILLVVLLVVWVEGCTSDAKARALRDLPLRDRRVGNASARLGQQLGTLLTTPGLNQEDLDAKLGGFVQTAENQVQTAQDLDPPGPMVGPNEGAVEALQYRVNGLQGLQTAFQETADETDARRRRGAARRPGRIACSRATSSGPTRSRRPRAWCSRTRGSRVSTFRRRSS